MLNANYLLARLREEGVAEHLPVAYDRICMHEFVLSGAPAKRELGVKTLDLAKRMLDFGYHPPTVYFPLLVDEALLVEPTETESKETLDDFADAVAAILREAAQDPEIARNAPYTTPVRRLDEAGAAKRPRIRAVAPGLAVSFRAHEGALDRDHRCRRRGRRGDRRQLGRRRQRRGRRQGPPRTRSASRSSTPRRSRRCSSR